MEHAMASAEVFQAHMRELRLSTHNRWLSGNMDVMGRVGSLNAGLRVGAVWYFGEDQTVRGNVAISGVRQRPGNILSIPNLVAGHEGKDGSTTEVACNVPLSIEWLDFRLPTILGALSLRTADGQPVTVGPHMHNVRADREALAVLSAGVTALLHVGESNTFGGLSIMPFGSLDA
jgi:hypothetical protein